MSLPTKIIAPESLNKRWGMSFSDIFLMFLNHDELRPVHGENDEWKYFGPDEEHDPVELLLSEGKDKRIIFLQRWPDSMETIHPNDIRFRHNRIPISAFCNGFIPG